MEEKRKTKTSSAVKQRYNEKTYDIISYREKKEIVATFKKLCEEKGVSQAQVLREAVYSFIETNK